MLVQASQAHGRLVDLTTDGVPARERIDYWRDVVLRLASDAGGVMATSVGDAMHAIHTVEWDDEVRQAMALMTDRPVRHLMVQRDGTIVGLVSIGDLVKATIAEQEGEITRLHHYITGQPD